MMKGMRNQYHSLVNIFKEKKKYGITEKQAYALVKVVKAIRPYLVGAKVISYVPNATIKDVVV